MEPQSSRLNVTEWSLLEKINDTSKHRRKPIILSNKAPFSLLSEHKYRPVARIGHVYQVCKVVKNRTMDKKHLKKKEDFLGSWYGYWREPQALAEAIASLILFFYIVRKKITDNSKRSAALFSFITLARMKSSTQQKSDSESCTIGFIERLTWIFYMPLFFKWHYKFFDIKNK